MKTTAALFCLITLAGCANPNLVGPRGNDLDTSYSLQDRRAAKQHVQITKDLPAGATVIGDFKAERCHQYLQEDAPGEHALTDDLVLLAYSEGADGITNLRFTKESGLLKNCWHVARVTATFYKNTK